MAHRIEVSSRVPDARAAVRKRHLESLGFSGRVKEVHLVDVYTLGFSLERGQLESVASMLANPVTQQATINQLPSPNQFRWAVEIGYLPGVTDNVGSTAKEGIEDLLKAQRAKFWTERTGNVYTSQVTFLSGDLSREDAALIAESLATPLVQEIQVKSYDEFKRDQGM